MTKSMFGGYNYLSKEDSLLYDQVKDNQDTKDKIIKKLIEDKASDCQTAHRNSTY